MGTRFATTVRFNGLWGRGDKVGDGGVGRLKVGVVIASFTPGVIPHTSISLTQNDGKEKAAEK
jgi:hypothetical protein